MNWNGEVLKRLRVDRRWSRNRLCQEMLRSHDLSVTDRTIANWENPDLPNEPRGSECAVLAAVLEVDQAIFFSEECSPVASTVDDEAA